jgi:hypothetical protein
MGRGMRRKSRVKSRIVLVIAYVGSIALLAGHYQDLSQRERVLRTHLIEDVATRLADFMALHARLLKKSCKTRNQWTRRRLSRRRPVIRRSMAPC